MGLELRKLRHKHLALISLALLAFELAWLSYGYTDNRMANTDFRIILWQLPMLNAIFLPLLSCIVASTICDVETPGHMLKELLTVQSPQKIFRTKWCTSALVIAVVLCVQTAAVLCLIQALGFPTPPDALTITLYWISSLAVCLLVATLAQALCLLLQNQFLPMVMGVALSFVGLFSMYLPTAFARLIPSSYYALLSTVEMDFDQGAQTMTFATKAWSAPDFAVIVLLCVALYVSASHRFSSKEL